MKSNTMGPWNDQISLPEFTPLYRVVKSRCAARQFISRQTKIQPSLVFLVLVVVAIQSLGAAGGLMLFSSNGSTHVSAVQYETCSSPSAHIFYLTVKSGKRFQIQSSGIVAHIPYPDSTPTVSRDDAEAMLAQLKMYAHEYPQYAQLLNNAAILWKRKYQESSDNQAKAAIIAAKKAESEMAQAKELKQESLTLDTKQAPYPGKQDSQTTGNQGASIAEERQKIVDQSLELGPVETELGEDVFAENGKSTKLSIHFPAKEDEPSIFLVADNIAIRLKLGEATELGAWLVAGRQPGVRLQPAPPDGKISKEGILLERTANDGPAERRQILTISLNGDGKAQTSLRADMSGAYRLGGALLQSAGLQSQRAIRKSSHEN